MPQAKVDIGGNLLDGLGLAALFRVRVKMRSSLRPRNQKSPKLSVLVVYFSPLSTSVKTVLSLIINLAVVGHLLWQD
jgi:hypothetical protein